VKLGFKFAALLVLPLVVLTLAFGYAYQQRSQALLREELTKEGRAIALVVQTAAEDYLRDRQPADLRKLVDQITGYERVLGLRIFGPDGQLIYQSSTLTPYPFSAQGVLQQVLQELKPAEMRQQVGGQSVLGFLFPLSGRGGRLLGAGQVLQLESYMEADARANRDFFLTLTLAMVLATVTIILLVTRFSMTRPIAELEHSFRQVGGGDLPARVPVRGDDELGRLALEFNRMCERLESAHRSLESEQRRRKQVEDRLRNAQRLAGLGRLAAGLAHEIGTPLNVISGRTDALLRHLADDERSTRNLKAISTQSERIVRIVRDMLDFARMKTPRRMPTSVAELVHTVVDLSHGELERNGVAVQVEIPEELPAVIADADQLQQVFMNLVVNARDAMTSGGTLRITAVDQSLPHPERGGVARRHAVVSFEDTGAGIPAEHRERVFDPFFTTKEPGKGMGLGLAVSYGIVEEHGGWFDLESHPGQGTRVTVYLPIEGEPVDEGPTQSEVV